MVMVIENGLLMQMGCLLHLGSLGRNLLSWPWWLLLVICQVHFGNCVFYLFSLFVFWCGIRLLRNRVSAQQARERKKAYLIDLEVRVKELETKNAELEERLSTMQNENQMLRQVTSFKIVLGFTIFSRM